MLSPASKMQRQRYGKCSDSYVILLVCLMSPYMAPVNGQNATSPPVGVDVGVILDFDSAVGKMNLLCMSMALEDFYAGHENYTTRIVPHVRDSKSDNVEAASAAIDLLKNVLVQAILGPQRSTQADFVIDIGNKAQVPIISLATSPSLSPKENPFFTRSSQCSSSQTKVIAAIVKAFGWRQVAVLFEDNDYGNAVVPHLTDALLEVNAQVRNRSAMSPSAADSKILEELYRLKRMPTRVFVVHMLPALASRLFLKAKEAGMMSKEYAWIITDTLTSLLDSMDPVDIENNMQGVLGVKPYVPKSNELENFTKRWKWRFRQENPYVDRTELNVFGLWAYDSIFALAMAVERAGVAPQQFKKPVSRENLTDLSAIGISEVGSKLLQFTRNIRLKGLSGDFHIVDGQLQPSAYRIVNVIGRGERGIGFWTKKYGISNEVLPSDNTYTANKDDLGAIIWPGETSVIPKGWEIPTSEKKLKVGVPLKSGFGAFITVVRDSQSNATTVTGFCKEVFEAVMGSLPYAVPCELIPFVTTDGEAAGSYDDLVYQIFLERFDAVVGDVTILANRSRFVDFTLPFMESGVSLIVPFKDDERKNAWIFMKPLTMDLWLTTGAFFIFTGFVIWVLEHRVNKEFRGPPHKQVGIIFWFSFSTLVFAHKEKVISNLSRFVVIVWVFVVLVLTSSYTASLTSMLTVQQLQPAVTDISDLLKNGEYIGYQTGSFIEGLLKDMKYDDSKFRTYNTPEEYDEALSKGSRNGGVAAILEELPYIRRFLAKYCTKYTAVSLSYKTAGFGFAFPKGSPLVPDVSRAVLTEGEMISKISREWLGEEANCSEQDGAVVTSQSLTLDSFKGLFLIAGVSSSSALIIFVVIFIYDNRNILVSSDSIWQKFAAMARTFDAEKEMVNSSSAGKKASAAAHEGASIGPQDNLPDCSQSPAISIFDNAEGTFSQDEGFSTTEPGTPLQDSIAIVDSDQER